MNSTLKIAIPLVLLIAVVFAVTFFSQYTPNDDTGPKDDSKGATNRQRPLVFFNNTRRWNPHATSEDGITPTPLADQIFQGFYEPGETQHSAAFWFENRNPAPVKLQLVSVSCTACSGGRLAPIPPDSMRQLLQMNAAAMLPTGPLAGCPGGMSGVAASLFGSLQWQTHTFQDPSQVVYNVPGAANADGWSPQWGILDLNFKVRQNPSVPLGSHFTGEIQGSEEREDYKFAIYFDSASAFELARTQVDIGTLAENSAEQVHDVIVFSTTRTFAEMEPLKLRATVQVPTGGDPGPFVTVGGITPLSEKERERFATELAAQIKRPVRVRAAFRLPVHVRARVGEARADIGKLVRDIWVSATLPGTDPKRIAVSGNVTGPVVLVDRTAIDLGSFPFNRDYSSRPFDIATERPGMELVLVPGECRPQGLKVKLEKQPDRQGRGHYKLWVDVPANEQQGEIVDGVVVLSIKDRGGQKVRFPVKGRGTVR